jgi:hypothetical protein
LGDQWVKPGAPAHKGEKPKTRRQERVMAKARKAAQTGGRTALTAELADILRQLKSLMDPYHPELHYMRGPGPKWHAKHRPAAAEAQPVPGLFHADA